MGILIAIIIFCIIVVFHELGHFLLAKKNGIRVDEFAIGMGPKLCGFKKGETEYVIRMIPFGGACMMAGEDQDTVEEGTFNSKSVWARISVVLAGPVFNFIMAFGFALFLLWNAGITTGELYQVEEGRPAAMAGLQVGDVITSIDGEKIHMFKEISMHITLNPADAYTVTYERDDEEFTTVIETFIDENGSKRIGIGAVAVKPTIGQLFQYSAYEVGYNIELVVKSLGMLVTGQLGKDDVAGPVGMVTVIDDTYDEAKDYGAMSVILTMANLIIILSANLGVMNLLPIPALDGGRLLFLIVEVFRGKPLDPNKEGFVNFVGFVLVMILMVFILFNDISKLFV